MWLINLNYFLLTIKLLTHQCALKICLKLRSSKLEPDSNCFLKNELNIWNTIDLFWLFKTSTKTTDDLQTNKIWTKKKSNFTYSLKIVLLFAKLVKKIKCCWLSSPIMQHEWDLSLIIIKKNFFIVFFLFPITTYLWCKNTHWF